MCKEVDGLCLRLHYCTPGLVRTSAESTPYKGATSPIPIIIVIIIVVVIVVIIIRGTYFCDTSTNETFAFLTETYKHISFNLIVSMKKVSCVYCERHLIGLTVTC